MPGQVNLSARGQIKSAHDVEQGRLSGPGRPDDAGQLSQSDFQIYTSQRPHRRGARIGLGDPPE